MKNNLALFLLLIASLPSFSQVDLNAGLMAYYPFTGNANDASGNGNNPVFNNATLTTDRFGNPNSAYSFNGTDNYIRIPNSASLNSSNQISICAWVKVAGFYQGVCHGNNVVMKGDADFQPGDYDIRFDDSYFTNSQNCFISTPDLAHEAFFGINAIPFSTTPFVQTNQWYNVVYTCDGSTAKIYVDCKLVGSGPANGITFTNGSDLFLGSMNNAQYPYWFNGTMDEVRIYNRALNEDEIKAYGDCLTSTSSCSNWLATPSVPSYVDVGQLNVTGNQITVEALINRTTPYAYGTGNGTEGDVVSKHDNPTDVNYLLRPNHCYITTTNGFFATPDIPDINLNQTYHIAMVYDGVTLKFYRDGCLVSQVAASGNLFQNSWDTRIGYYQNEIWNTNFIGYINEVRIWNVARTQSELRTYMNSSLPNPTTQPGLLAYYTFDNLINKQGNPAWNGTLGGTASINQTNPSCNAIPVSMISVSDDTTICDNTSVKLFASGGSSYSWSPASTLNDATSSTPIASPLSSTVYNVQVTDSASCIMNDSVKISVTPAPVIAVSDDTTMCSTVPVQLFVSGGNSYVWSPASSLNNATSATPIASPLSSTLYHVRITDANSCIYNDSVNIAISPKPVIKISTDTAICIHNSVQIFVSGGNSYSWSPTSSLDNSTSATPLASPLSSTLYHVQITSANSCMYNDSVKVSVNPANAIIKKSNDTAICHNTSVQIFASGGNTYAWTPASSLNNVASPTPIATPLSTTEYYVKITDVNSCIYNDSVKISIKPIPLITNSDDTTICNKASVQLFVSGGSNYVWSPSSSLNNATTSTPVASPISTTVYQVTITDANSCINLGSIKVTVRPPVVFSVSPDNSVCTSNSQQLSASGGDTYTWSPANSLDNPNSSDPIATPNQTTTYTVNIKETTCNESATLSTILTVLPVPTVHAIKSNDITCTAPSARLTALGAQDYSWSPTDGLDNANIANPVASPQSSTVYILTGKDQNGCVGTDSVSVNVDYDKNVFYGMPNSFTPNGDGLNDCFGVAHWGQVSELDFSVYNRFGQRVFYTHNTADCWDGTFKGTPQDAAIFVYVVKAKTACGIVSRKGTVTLIR